MTTSDEAGAARVDAFKADLARDLPLQIAGLVDLAQRPDIDLGRLIRDVRKARDSNVLIRLAESVDLLELVRHADGETISLEDLEERVPHSSVIYTFESAQAVAALAGMFESDSGE